MAECVNWVQASLVDGGDVYSVTVLAPQSPEDTAAAGCSYGYVLTPEEMQKVAALIGGTAEPGPGAGANALLNMSVEDGVILSGAIVVLWCVAWGIRALRKAL